MDQLESIAQPMNQWGHKEGRQVVWQRTPIHIILLYVFTLTAWKVAKTTAHQRIIKFNNSRSSYLDPKLYTFVPLIE